MHCLGPIAGAVLVQNFGMLSGSWYGLDMNFFNSFQGYQLSPLLCWKDLTLVSSCCKLTVCTHWEGDFSSYFGINNGNWTEWSAIWSEIIHVISKSNKHAKRVWFEITSMISDQNCTTRSSIHFEIAQFNSLNTRTTRTTKVAKFAKQEPFCLSFSSNVIG